MNDNVIPRAILLALFDLARAGCPADRDVLAGRLGVRHSALADGLAGLSRRGLVDASRCRLTLSGLAIAASLVEAREARASARASTSAAA